MIDIEIILNTILGVSSGSTLFEESELADQVIVLQIGVGFDTSHATAWLIFPELP